MLHTRIHRGCTHHVKHEPIFRHGAAAAEEGNDEDDGAPCDDDVGGHGVQRVPGDGRHESAVGRDPDPDAQQHTAAELENRSCVKSLPVCLCLTMR